MRLTRGNWAGKRVAPNTPPSFRGGPKDRTRNLEVLRCAIAHHSSVPRTAPERHRVSLPPHPFRRPLLGKRLWSLDIVLRLHHRLHGGIIALLGDRLLQRDAEAPLDR